MRCSGKRGASSIRTTAENTSSVGDRACSRLGCSRADQAHLRQRRSRRLLVLRACLLQSSHRGGELMRGILFACAVVCLIASAPHARASALTAAPAAAISAAPTTFALQVPDKKIEVTVGDRGGVWYRSPV